MGEGNVFTGVCLFTGGISFLGSFLRGGWVSGLKEGGCLVRGRGVWSEGVGVWSEADPPEIATATVGGMHPTGMHSYSFWFLIINFFFPLRWKFPYSARIKSRTRKHQDKNNNRKRIKGGKQSTHIT